MEEFFVGSDEVAEAADEDFDAPVSAAAPVGFAAVSTPPPPTSIPTNEWVEEEAFSEEAFSDDELFFFPESTISTGIWSESMYSESCALWIWWEECFIIMGWWVNGVLSVGEDLCQFWIDRINEATMTSTATKETNNNHYINATDA